MSFNTGLGESPLFTRFKGHMIVRLSFRVYLEGEEFPTKLVMKEHLQVLMNFLFFYGT